MEHPKEWSNKCQDKIDLEKFDVVLTNPPFGSKIPVKEEKILKQYSFGHKWTFDKKEKKWELQSVLRTDTSPDITMYMQSEASSVENNVSPAGKCSRFASFDKTDKSSPDNVEKTGCAEKPFCFCPCRNEWVYPEERRIYPDVSRDKRADRN